MNDRIKLFIDGGTQVHKILIGIDEENSPLLSVNRLKKDFQLRQSENAETNCSIESNTKIGLIKLLAFHKIIVLINRFLPKCENRFNSWACIREGTFRNQRRKDSIGINEKQCGECLDAPIILPAWNEQSTGFQL